MLAQIDVSSTIADAVHAYLASRFPAAAPFAADTQLLEGGVIDSLGFLELMVFLGEKFGIALEDEDFDPANLATPASLVAFVARKHA